MMIRPVTKVGSEIRPREGFTLIELTVTVLILAILAAVTAPKFAASLDRIRAESAAKRIKADLGLVRQKAISSSSTKTIQFSTVTHSYTILGLEDLNHPGQPYTVSLTTYPYKSALVSASLGGDSDLQFDRYGQPDSEGTITVQSGSFQQTVTINPDTGKATIP